MSFSPPNAHGGSGIPASLLSAKGSLIAASAAATAADLVVGGDGEVLTADAASADGVKWAAASGGISPTIFDAKGDLLGASAADTPARVAVGANGTVLVADSTQGTGVLWRALAESDVANLVTDLAAKIAASIVDAKGDLIAATAADTVARLAVGSDGQVLTADAASAAGVKWATPAAAPTLSMPQPSIYFFGTNTIGFTASGDVHGVYIWVPWSMTFTKYRLNISTSSGNIDIGVFSADGATMYQHLGSTASPGTGLRDFTISGGLTLSAGQYILCVTADNSTLRLRAPAANDAWQAVAKTGSSIFPLAAPIAFAAETALGYTVMMLP